LAPPPYHHHTVREFFIFVVFPKNAFSSAETPSPPITEAAYHPIDDQEDQENGHDDRQPIGSR
jgi:hypothetical protein